MHPGTRRFAGCDSLLGIESLAVTVVTEHSNGRGRFSDHAPALCKAAQIHRGDGLPMVAKKGEPTLGLIRIPGHPLQAGSEIRP